MRQTEQSTSGIVVVGSANIDLMLAVPHLPRPGETLSGSDFASGPGGKGANQAVAAARLGAAVSFVGCIGDDAFGAQARDALRASGASVEHLHTVPGIGTGVAIVLRDAAGENCIALDAGANRHLQTRHIDLASALIGSARLLVCQLETPLETVAHALDLARRLGVATLLNPAPACALPDTMLRGLDFLVPNASEASFLTGIEVTDPSTAAEAARLLRVRGVQTVLLTMGASGVLLADAGGVAHFPAQPVEAVDTTGAGDTFVGAFAAAWTRGDDLRAAIAFAQRAAAFGVQGRGAQASMPHLGQLGEGAG